MGSTTTTTTPTADPRPIRLAILEADTPIPPVLERHGRYGSIFTRLFTETLPPTTPLPSVLTLSSHDIVSDPTSYPDPSTLDAVLISGSKHNSFDNDAWILRLVEYTRALLDEGRVRIVGVCFGHQILARAMGTGVGRSDKGWEVAVVPLELTDEGRRIFGLDTLRIHQMHRDEAHAYPPTTIPLARNAICDTQAMYVPRRLIAVQGHPEFTEDMVREILALRHASGLFSDEVYEDGMRRVGDEHDGVAIARAFLRFLRE